METDWGLYLTYEGLKHSIPGDIREYQASGLYLTYEGLKLTGLLIVGVFRLRLYLTYEGLKLRYDKKKL